MTAKASALRVLLITVFLSMAIAIIATWLYHPAVHRKLLVGLVLLVTWPMWVALRRVDRLVFRHRRLRGLPEIVRTGLVVLAGITLAATVMAISYLLAMLAGIVV